MIRAKCKLTNHLSVFDPARYLNMLDETLHYETIREITIETARVESTSQSTNKPSIEGKGR